MMMQMYKKKTGQVVDVAQIFWSEAGYPIALVYDHKADCWEQIRISKLRPCTTYEYRAKQRLDLRDGIWQTTDNCYYADAEFDTAIAHEISVIKQEEENERMKGGD